MRSIVHRVVDVTVAATTTLTAHYARQSHGGGYGAAMTMAAVTRRFAVEGLYVGAVMGVAATAWWDPNDVSVRFEAAAIVLTAPTSIVLSPLVYVALATSWNVTNADAGGSTWFVTATYTAVFGAVAVVQAMATHRLLTAWNGRRSRAAPGS